MSQRSPYARKPVQSLAGPTTASDLVRGVALQIARKYLFVPAETKALVYSLVVTLLSLIAGYAPLPENWYFNQKSNVLNQFGVKLGWLWLCVLLWPFLFYAHRARGGGTMWPQAVRMVVATAAWFFLTSAFVHWEQRMASCHGYRTQSRDECSAHGGKWEPGLDISGHCFIIIYTILIIAEESVAFRNLTSTTQQADVAVVKIFFIALAILNLLWDFQLVISVLYFHTIDSKLIGAGFAIATWYLTYRIVFPTIAVAPTRFAKTRAS